MHCFFCTLTPLTVWVRCWEDGHRSDGFHTADLSGTLIGHHDPYICGFCCPGKVRTEQADIGTGRDTPTACTDPRVPTAAWLTDGFEFLCCLLDFRGQQAGN